MSCIGKDCDEPIKRRKALGVFGLLLVIFIVLSGFSFLNSRGQVTPDTVSFGPHQATDGKRVFQAYNCMGCHTMVGNGAYFGPDLTKEYTEAGPAWLAAFIPSAGGWPTEGAVRTQLLNPDIAAAAGVSTIDDYYKKYPGARDRVERRGGGTTMMPNLPLGAEEVGQMIAFLKYTSAMDTEGWPAEVKIAGTEKRLALLHRSGAALPIAAAAASGAPATAVAAGAVDPVVHGEKLAQEYACTACHALDSTNRVTAPGWGGLYGASVTLADGSTTPADDGYLIESIRKPREKLVAGYAPTMPDTYNQMLSDDDVRAIVDYIRSLKK